MFPDYYKKLGLRKSATKDEIKKSFRRLALLYHPDKNKSPDAHERFIVINQAYLVLSNDDSRFSYDREYDYHLQQIMEERARAKRANDYKSPEPAENIRPEKTNLGFAEMVFSRISTIFWGALKIAYTIFCIFILLALALSILSGKAHSYSLIFFCIMLLRFVLNNNKESEES